MEWSKIYKLTFLSSNFFSCIIGFFENSLKHKIYCFETFFFNNFQKNEYYPYIRSSPHVSTDIFSYKFHIFPIFQHVTCPCRGVITLSAQETMWKNLEIFAR